MSGATYNPAVMSGRVEPRDSLDFFPTPAWGTRALCEYILPQFDLEFRLGMVWEPACGEGHMVEVLAEYFHDAIGSDVHDYGRGYPVGSFVGVGADVMKLNSAPQWIITNPPFNLAEEFVRRALVTATVGVAMLARTTFIESDTRFPLFSGIAFAANCPFASRLPMVQGQWDPKASSATSYAWFIWLKLGRASAWPHTMIIPPQAKARCSRPEDIARFAGPQRCGIAGLSKKKRADHEADAPLM